MSKAHDPPRLIKREGKRVSVDEIAAIEFTATMFRGMSQDERLRTVDDIAENVRVAAAIASEILTKTKAELIALVEAQLDVLGPQLMVLAEAGEHARALAQLIKSAEMRLAGALANVEGGGDNGRAA